MTPDAPDAGVLDRALGALQHRPPLDLGRQTTLGTVRQIRGHRFSFVVRSVRTAGRGPQRVEASTVRCLYGERPGSRHLCDAFWGHVVNGWGGTTDGS